MKKVLILGAGIYQVPLIETAKKLGYETIVCSIKGDYPGFKLADKIYYVDTKDSQEILKIAIKEDVLGICTAGTDVAIQTVGYVCDRLDLVGISEEASIRATDKSKMKVAFEKGGVVSSKYKRVCNLKEAIAAYQDLGPKAVLKVTDQSGSRGVIVINNENELLDIFESTIKGSENPYLLLEEFVEGHEIGVDAFVENGKIIFILPHDKITYNYKGTGIPIGHIFPYYNDVTIIKEIENQTKLVIDSLGLDNCAVNIDAFVKEDGVVSIIEAGGRSGATGIPELVSLLCNYNYYEMIINNCMGIVNPQIMIVNQNCASRLIFSQKDGKLSRVKIKPNDFMKISIDIEKGHEVKSFVNGTCRIGQAIIKTDNKEELYQALEAFDNYVSIELEK